MLEWEVLADLNPWMNFMTMEQADSLSGRSIQTQSNNEMKHNFKMWKAGIEQAKRDK